MPRSRASTALTPPLLALALLAPAATGAAEPAADGEATPEAAAPDATPEAATPDTAPDAALAPAPPPRRAIAFTVGGGLRAFTTSAIDLAGLADAPGFGAADDTAPLALGFGVEGGVIIAGWELLAQAHLGLGGLNLSHVEDRYFASEPESIGSNLTAGLGLAGRRLFRLGADAELAAGLRAGYLLMTAASPAGSAFFRAVDAGPELEIRYRLHGRRGDREGGGWLGIGVDARALLPIVAEVSSGDDSKFALDGTGDVIWLIGGALTYRFDGR